MSQDTIKLNLAAGLQGGTKQAFRAIADSFKMLGKEIKASAKAAHEMGKTEVADALGHTSMAVDRTVNSYKEMAKTGKMMNQSVQSSKEVLSAYSGELGVVQKAFKKWSDSGKASGDHLKAATSRTNKLSNAIHQMGVTLKSGGASAQSITKWKESLDFNKVMGGLKSGQLKPTVDGFKELNSVGMKLLNVQGKIETAFNKSGGAHRLYNEQLKLGSTRGVQYRNAIRQLTSEHGKGNEAVDRWSRSLGSVHRGMERVRDVVGSASKNMRHWTNSSNLAAVRQEFLQGNLQTTTKGFKIMNEQGLKAFNGLTIQAADKLGLLSKRFDNLSVAKGAKTITAYGKAVDASVGKSDKFSLGLQKIANKYGVVSARFSSHYEDMKKSDAIWNKHVTTLQKSGKISSKTAGQMLSSFNAVNVSSVKLAENLARPNKQYEELRKTINRVSVATGKSTEDLWKQTKALQAQRVPHDKIVNAMNEKIGVNREYAGLQKTLAIQEQKLADLTGTSAEKMKKYSDRAKDRATTDKELVQVSKNLIKQYGTKIKSMNEENSAVKRMGMAKVRLVKQYGEEIRASKEVQKQYRNTIKGYKESSLAGKEAEVQLERSAKSFRKASESTSLFGRALASVKIHIKSFASYATAASFIAGIVGGFQQATVAIIEFDQALKDLQAITGATDREVALMGETIKHVASTTKFSATEVAAGMKTLGQAGLSAKEAVQTIQAVSDLATGTLSDMGTSVDLVTTAMRVFDIKATDSGRIADVFANAVNRSKLTIDKLRIAFNYVGPIAARAGVSFEEVASSMMTLANSGVRASTIGTGLRQVFSKLVKPTAAFKEAVLAAGFAMDDFDLKQVSMRKVIERLSIVVTDAGDAFKFFGLRGATAISALTQANVKGFDAMLDAVSKTGTAASMASTQMEGLGVKIKNMFDKAKNLAIALGETGLGKALHVVVDVVRNLIDVFTAVAGAPVTGFILKVTTSIAAVIALTAAVKGLMGLSMVQWFVSTGGAASGFSVAMTGAAASVRAFFVSMGPVGWALLAIAAGFLIVSKSTKAWKSSAKEAYDESKNLAEEFEVLKDKIEGYREKVVSLDESSKEFKNANLVLRGELSKVSERLDSLGDFARKAELSINALDGSFIAGTQALKDYYAEVKKLEAEQLLKAAESADQAFADSLGVLSESYDKLKGTFKGVKEGVVALGHAVLDSLSFDSDGASEQMKKFKEATWGAFVANIELNKAVGAFEKGGKTFKELKTILLDSKIASSEFGKSLLASMKVVEESASKALREMLAMNKVDFRDSNAEIIKMGVALGYIADETGFVAQAVAYLSDEMRASAAGATNGLASSWAKELDGIGISYKQLADQLNDDRDTELKGFNDLNGKIIKGFEDRQQAIVDAWNANDAMRSEKGSSYEAEYYKTQIELNAKALKLQQEMRANRDTNRKMEVAKARKARDEDLRANEQFYDDDTIGREAYTRKSIDIMEEYRKKYKLIMGDMLDPKEARAAYKKYKELRETESKNQLLALEKRFALGLITEVEYNRKRVQLALETNQLLEAEAKRSYDKINSQKDVKPVDVEKQFKLWQDAEQNRLQAEINSIKLVHDEKLENEKKIEGFNKKRVKEHDKHLKKIVDLEEKSSTKIAGIQTKLQEKIAELVKKRVEVEKKAQRTLQDNHDSLADKIRGIGQRGMSDVQKEYDNALWAQQKYTQGLQIMKRAAQTGDQEQLDRAKKILEDSSGLYENLEDSGDAIAGLKKVGKALDSTVKIGLRLDKNAINREIRKEKKKANIKIKEIQRVEGIAITSENKRHKVAMDNLAKLILKWQELGHTITGALTPKNKAIVPIKTTETTDTHFDFSPKKGLGEGVTKVGGEWVAATDAAREYNAEVDRGEATAESTATKTKRTADKMGDAAALAKAMSDSSGKIKDDFKTVSETAIEPTVVALTADDIETIILHYSNKLEQFRIEQSKNSVSIISAESVDAPLEEIKDKYQQTREWMQKSIIEVIVELGESAYRRLKQRLEDLRNTKIVIPVTVGTVTGNPERFAGGGIVGGPNAYSSTRDTEWVKARKGEAFVDNEASAYWGKGIMEGIIHPFSKMGRVVSSALQSPTSMNRTNATVDRSMAEGMFEAVQSFGTVNLNLPTSGPPVPIMLKQNDMDTFLNQLKTMGKFSS